MNIAVIGAGHVGLVTGACLAHVGHSVLMVENDPARLSSLRAEPPRVPIYEPGLEELVASIRADRPEQLRFTGSIREAVEVADVAFICVGTPQGERGEANLYYVEKVASEIAESLGALNKEHFVIVEKSTVPVRTGEAVRRTVERVLGRRPGKAQHFEVVSNPEFLAEGTAVRDFFFPDRIVIGVESNHGEEVLRKVYQPILDQQFDWHERPEREPPAMVVTDVQSAELIKHASNSFLALKISFINAVANLCEKAGADVREVARGMGLDPRIGPRFLRAGAGFGGYCFPKDVAAFYHISQELGYPFEMLRQVLSINEGQRALIVDKLRGALWNLRDKKVLIWGVAFKPNTEDVRGSPALDVARRLLAEGAELVACDPAVKQLPEDLAGTIELTSSPAAAVKGAHAIVLMTEWNAFRDLSDEMLQNFAGVMHTPVFVDGRNVFEPARMRALGFEYYGIGVQ